MKKRYALKNADFPMHWVTITAFKDNKMQTGHFKLTDLPYVQARAEVIAEILKKWSGKKLEVQDRKKGEDWNIIAEWGGLKTLRYYKAKKA